MSITYPLIIQEQVIRSIRDFFYVRDFHEIISPVITETIPLEPNIYPFITEWHPGKKTKTFYLATSPERSLKLALAQGMDNCFAVGHCFRDLEGSGPIHSPEFLMLEWYRKNATYKDIMKEVQELFEWVRSSVGAIHQSPQPQKTAKKEWPTFSLIDLFQSHAHLSLKNLVHGDALHKTAREKGYSVGQATWSQLFDQLFLNEIEPHLPKEPFFLVDFPSRISPLCTPRKDKPYLAERFELFINGMELANGNTENTDTDGIAEVFRMERANRKRNGLPAPPEDTEFLDALKSMQGISYAGIGLGIDRLCLLLKK